MSKELTCMNCGKEFRLFQVNDPSMPARALGFHFMDPHGYFHSQRCAVFYGLKAAKFRQQAVDKSNQFFHGETA
jgi:hypothetical protein